ncbi:MAG: 50S ribosomal protein L6 [Planctomycetota bacterium]|nr:50S ribosomal protein L6 [Planctomycetota bacterium]MDA0920525.1 50S ribosomal protein L6 [Planctomycetota bacterium]
MSRIGKKPIEIPANVEVSVSGREICVKGPNGTLQWQHPEGVSVVVESDSRRVTVSRDSDTGTLRAFHGLTRALVNNMVVGVVEQFEKRLEIQGVGYQATLSGGELRLQVGFSHSVDLKVPSDVDCSLVSPTLIVVKGCNKHSVGQFAANIRAVRPPEPYKGKGIRYQGEHVRRKAGKAFGSK